MHVEDSSPEFLTSVAPDAEHQSRLDWAGLHRRLDSSRAALQRRLNPGPDEKQKILRARAVSLASAGKKESNSSRLTLEVVEFVLASEHYGIELSAIREIHSLSEYT